MNEEVRIDQVERDAAVGDPSLRHIALELPADEDLLSWHILHLTHSSGRDDRIAVEAHSAVHLNGARRQ